MTNEFNLSKEIIYNKDGGWLEIEEVKKFIRLLKDETLSDGVYEIETETQRDGLVDVKKLFNRINKLAGDKLK